MGFGLLVVVPVGLFPQKSPANLCYAFIRDGDLWTVCEGRRERTVFHPKALDVAFSADGSYFAVQEDLRTPDVFRIKQLLVSLKPRQGEFTRLIDSADLLHGTCGTIISYDYINEKTFDLVASRPIEMSPYVHFLCSSDRKTVAGWTERDAIRSRNLPPDFSQGGRNTRIMLTVNGPQAITHFLIDGGLEWDLSPEGRYVAYFLVFPTLGGPQLCVRASGAEPSCVYAQGGHASVSDTGEVLYNSEQGIRYWREGLKTTLILEGKGDVGSPVWITPDAVTLLDEWKAKKGTRP